MLTLLADTQARLDAARPCGPRPFGLLRDCDKGVLTASGVTVPTGGLCRVVDGGNDVGMAEVIGFRDGLALLMLLGDLARLRPGQEIHPANDCGTAGVGDALLGRVVDALGHPMDGGLPVRTTGRWPLGGCRESALERTSITEPFDCGVRAINAVATLGVGQRTGIVAGSGVGKSVLLDMIAGHACCDVAVVALIGERAREVSDFVRRHMGGAQGRRTVVVAVPADHAANLRLRGARFATAIAEHFRAKGKRVLLIVDSLTRVAHAAREIGLALGEPAAARGYPPSALTAITGLVERAGNSARSGGAVSGLYTVLADGDDRNDPVVDTARAILDGHIVLSRDLAARGHYPAIDVSASLSRVMDQVASDLHVARARELRRLVADYEANRDLVLMGAYQPGADPTVDRAMAMHPALAAFLAQPAAEVATLPDSVAALDTVLANGPA